MACLRRLGGLVGYQVSAISRAVIGASGRRSKPAPMGWIYIRGVSFRFRIFGGLAGGAGFRGVTARPSAV